ncbi:MAG TPA: hypothetical protein VM687_01580 [Stenotrophomonas sp.]|nr:hypothetical protein [Stenotrophomonas sp.]
MTMHRARIAIVLFGLILPYLSRLPGGREWLGQFTYGGWGGFLFMAGCSVVVWGGLLLWSLAYRRAASLWVPALMGFGFLAWAYGSINLRSDAQAGLGLLMIPIYSVVPVVVGGLIGLFLDWRFR